MMPLTDPIAGLVHRIDTAGVGDFPHLSRLLSAVNQTAAAGVYVRIAAPGASRIDAARRIAEHPMVMSGHPAVWFWAGDETRVEFTARGPIYRKSGLRTAAMAWDHIGTGAQIFATALTEAGFMVDPHVPGSSLPLVVRFTHPDIGQKLTGVECLTCHTEGPWTVSSFDQPPGSNSFVITCDGCHEPIWAEAALVRTLLDQLS